MPMTEFEPKPSGAVSDSAVNCATNSNYASKSSRNFTLVVLWQNQFYVISPCALKFLVWRGPSWNFGRQSD